MLITLIVEIIIASIFKIIKDIKIENIIYVNLITQIFLQVIIRIIQLPYLYLFLVIEIIIIIIEFILYKLLSKYNNNKKLINYVIFANTSTAALTFVIPHLVNFVLELLKNI